MRVLFLNHPEADYGGYGLYNGLCEVVGAENVVDYPIKWSYHGREHRYPSFYTHHDPTQIGKMYDVDEGGQAIGITRPFDWTVARPEREWDLGTVAAALTDGHFDVVVCESPRKTVIDSLRKLKPLLDGVRIVMHDGEDYADVHTEHVNEYGIGLYLKRELRPDTAAPTSCLLRPFSFSVWAPPLQHVDPLPAEIDVLCAIGDTDPPGQDTRRRVRDAVRALAAEGLRVDVRHRPWPDWIAACRRARVVVAPRGYGQDTPRRWEVPATGALLLCQRLTLVEENHLQDGRHCAYFDGADDFDHVVRFWLEHEPERGRVAREGQRFVFAHHTNATRARQLLAWSRERWPDIAPIDLVAERRGP